VRHLRPNQQTRLAQITAVSSNPPAESPAEQELCVIDM
jgi:hypothetical protein